MFHLSIREERADRHVLTRSPLTPAVPVVLIVGLQDTDKIGHAGSIPVFGRNRSLSIGRGLARLPKPREEIDKCFHGGLSVAVDTNYWNGNAPLDQEKGRRALRRRPCPATAGAGSVALRSAFVGSTEHWLTPLHAGMK
jgi:hypothetical protein